MAGVGFSLRKLQGSETYTGLVRLYASAGMISSGPWLISIFTLLFVGFLGAELAPDAASLGRFQVSVTWLFAVSLVLSTPCQLLFTRFVSDLLYEKRQDLALPNLWGALTVMSGVSATVALAAAPLFAHESFALKLVLTVNLVVLGNVWIVLVMLGALKEHGKVVSAFALGYAATFVACLLLAQHGEVGLLLGFLFGHVILLWWSIAVITRVAPSSTPIAWGFFQRRKVHLDLLLTGLLYGLGIWVDKLVFWYHTPTSHAVLGPFRASDVYDFPVFLAYLAITPGMTAFLLTIETDYAEKHSAFFSAIEEGASLSHLDRLRNELVLAARRALGAIFRVQGVTFVLCLILGGTLLELFGISRLHLPLFYVDVAAVSMQVLLLAVISILFYLDRRILVLKLVALLCLSNLGGTLLSIAAGSAFYGYGFALATSLTTLVATAALNSTLHNVLRDTFMKQG